MKLPFDVREFEAYGQRWRAIRQASGPLHPILAAGDAPPAGVLFVDEAQDLDKSQLDLALLLAGEGRERGR